MGLWSYYFFAKLFLYFGKFIGFHVWENLAFAVFVTIPLPLRKLRILRTAVAVPLGVALLYHDTFLPPIRRVIAEAGNLAGFSLQYLFELGGRFINPAVVSALVVLFLICGVLQTRLRLTTFAFLGILAVPLVGQLSFTLGGPAPQARPTTAGVATAAAGGPASDQELTAALDSFYEKEGGRRVSFSRGANLSAAPFDIVLIHVCSLAWDDLAVHNEQDAALWSRFDVLFKNFNSAASYSGPAAIRVLRSNCGQPRHNDLYKPTDSCHLFSELGKLGFETRMTMNHDGKYGDFLKDLRERGGLTVPQDPWQDAAVAMHSFDGSPIRSDYGVLSKWWTFRQGLKSPQVALYYNTITLHDGNRLPGMASTSSLATFKPRLSALLSDIDKFLDLLQQSGRRVVVVFVPEHGASLHGDKTQIAGMREIPSPRITLVPVGIKLIGFGGQAAPGKGGRALVVDQPMSYLGLTQLLANFVADNPYAGKQALEDYLQELPQTNFVAENDDVVVMRRGSRYYMRTPDKTWVEYENNP